MQAALIGLAQHVGIKRDVFEADNIVVRRASKRLAASLVLARRCALYPTVKSWRFLINKKLPENAVQLNCFILLFKAARCRHQRFLLNRHSVA